MKKFAVIGNPIEQSKSPIIHKHFADQFGIELEYTKILAPVDGFKSAADAFFKSGGLGMNVTMPFKDDAFNYADELTQRAKLAEAVNTLIYKDSKIIGDTTDGEGVIRDHLFHDVEITGMRVLLIGAGGAAKGSVESILKQTPLSLTIGNRTVSKAQAIAAKFPESNVDAKGFNELTNEYDVIINSTSCSLTGELPDIDPTIFSNAKSAYDMCYKKETTLFNKWVEENSAAKTIDGLGMLIEQAAESFSIWHGKMPDTRTIRQTLREA